jgi:cysteine desulfurase family protein
MQMIYADNAATSFPKPPEVSKAMCNYIDKIGGNVGRGTYENSYNAGRVVYETRELLCNMFNFDDPLKAIFTSNITESLNILIKGLLKSGDHVIVSSMEHNAVMRPLSSKQLDGVEITKVICNDDGSLYAQDLKDHIKKNTRLVIMMHVSNVCGTILPIKDIGKICKENNIYFIIDAAQSAGVLDIDFKEFNLSALAFTGHKGLMGPQGVGGFLINDNLGREIRTLKEGGTGSFSELEFQPQTLPDKFECGTLNTPGIYGLNAALKFVKSIGISNIRSHEEELTNHFLDKIKNISGVDLHGINSPEGRTAVFSLSFGDFDNAEIAFMLEREFGVLTRVGLHCAPSAHKTLGTFPRGTVRFSFGYFNKISDIEYIACSIYKSMKLLKQ